MSNPKVLVTGGAGYVGSQVCQTLMDNGLEPIIIDLIDDGLKRVVGKYTFYSGTISDNDLIDKVFDEHDIEFVIHCVIKTNLSNSSYKPKEYYKTNLIDSLSFFDKIIERGCKKIIFTSSGMIYDSLESKIIVEESRVRPKNPLAKSKYMLEQVLQDYCYAYGVKCISIRLFNPIGADLELRTGPLPGNNPSVVTRLIRVNNLEEKYFDIYGDDWKTVDGTCIRDYVHIVDVAKAYYQAIVKFDEVFRDKNVNFEPINIGSGYGVTVRQLITSFENVTGDTIPTRVAIKRREDHRGSYASIIKAKQLLDWKPEWKLEDGILDAIRWYDDTRDM